MTFKFIDKLEKDITTYLYDYNQKGWAWRGTEKLGEFPEGALRDDKSDVLSWLARSQKCEGLKKRLEECMSDLDRIRQQDASMIDAVDDQIKRIDQMAVILQYLSSKPMYTKWETSDLLKGVDHGCLPQIKLLVKGHAKDPVLKPFPCPNATWEAVKITLISDDTVRIETPLGSGRFSYHEIGLNDKRSGDRPKKSWNMLKLFAAQHGKISRENTKYISVLPDTAKRLDYHLRDLFGIKERIYKGHYKKYKGYHTRIFFSDQTSAH